MSLMKAAGMTRRRALALGAGSLALPLPLASPAVLRAQSATQLRIGHGLPGDHPVHKSMQFFADRLREKTGGAFEATIFPDGVIGQEPNLLSQAQAGKLDFVKASASAMESIGSSYRVFNLPFMFRDRDHWRKIAINPIGERILESTATGGLVGLTYFEAGSRSFYANKPINHPDDLKGMKIRIQPSPTMTRLMQLFGAEGVALDWGLVYSALKQKFVDGAENSVGALVVGRHGEAVTHYSFDEHTMVPDVFLVSSARWATFTPVQREIVREAALASHRHMNDLWEAFDADMRKQSERMGVTFVHPDKKPFIARSEPLRKEFADDPEIGKLVAQITQS